MEQETSLLWTQLYAHLTWEFNVFFCALSSCSVWWLQQGWHCMVSPPALLTGAVTLHPFRLSFSLSSFLYTFTAVSVQFLIPQFLCVSLLGTVLLRRAGGGGRFSYLCLLVLEAISCCCLTQVCPCRHFPSPNPMLLLCALGLKKIYPPVSPSYCKGFTFSFMSHLRKDVARA